MKNNSNFLMGEIPNFHPRSLEYLEYWKQEKRSCIEGFWGQGYWMPGNLYFYVNHWHILLNTDNFSKAKSLAKPFCRDLEWQKAYIYAEARGFSGFAGDEEVTCFRLVEEFEKKLKAPGASKDNLKPSTLVFPPECFKADGTLKTYEHARDYVKKLHVKNLGKPLYQNEAKNVVDIECYSPNTQVLMGDFTRKAIKNIEIGDYVMGSNAPTKVIDKMSGVNQMYKITPSRGEEQIVSKGHLVHLRKRRYINGKKVNNVKEKGYYVTETLNIKAEDLIEKSKKASFKNMYQLYRGGCVSFPEHRQSINPYVLGLWLADGRSKECSIDVCDRIAVEEVSLHTGCEIKKRPKKDGRKQVYSIYFKQMQELRDMGLYDNKHIPLNYLQASKDQRLDLLAGIIDGDGSLQNNQFSIGEPREELAKQYRDLARSLGFSSDLSSRVLQSGSILYDVRVGGDIHTIPTKIERKRAEKTERIRSYDNMSFIIEPVEKGEFVGIEVEAEDHLFRLSDWLLGHNCRGSGKSYWAAGGMIAHNFLFDGATDYDAYLAAAASGKFMSSETLVGAISTSYTADLLSKVALGLESLLGGQHLDDGYYPSPLSKKTMGTLAPGKNPLVAKFKKDFGGSWKEVGSMSKIHHRSFKDKPTAGNGTRPGLTILEEVGFMGNLKDSLGPLKQCTLNGATKFGTIYMFGTGGDMDGGATEAVRDVFYEPDAWDCLVFDDKFENRGKIGYFVPYAYGLNQFKDEQGNTNIEEAQGFVDQVRYDLSKKKSKKPLNMEMQDNPNVPSEAFLVSTGNIFPIAELQDQLGWLESIEGQALSGQCGQIVPEPGVLNGMKWVPDLTNSLIPCDYPTDSGDDTDGCHVIWEHPPSGHIPHGMYLAGTDPYDQDRAPNSNSLGSTFIYKLGDIRDSGTGHMIVAEYTARPEKADDHHEEVRKLLMYYNASDLYENERNSIRMYFKTKNCLHLLTKQPDILKATENSKVERGHGTHMTIQIKEELELYARDWLTTSIGDNLYRYHLIFSKPLLKELIAYNKVGNFDRVIAFLLCIYNQLQNHHVKVTKVRNDIDRDPFFDDTELFT